MVKQPQYRGKWKKQSRRTTQQQQPQVRPQSGSRQVHWHTFWFRNIENATVHRSRWWKMKWCQRIESTCRLQNDLSSAAWVDGTKVELYYRSEWGGIVIKNGL